MRKFVRRTCKKVIDDIIIDKRHALDWILLSSILLMIAVSFYYVDYAAIFLSYFWDNQSLFDGKSLDLLGNNQMAYGMVQQILCRIWVMPINIAYTIKHFEVGNLFSYYWFKLGMALVYTLCMKEMIAIARLLKVSEERIKWMLLLMTSSVLVALPIFHISQTDILCGYMLLLALRYAVEEKKKRFLIFSMLAVSCKIMALIAFAPLLLLLEKRIFRVVIDSVIVVLVYPLENIWYGIVNKLNVLVFSKQYSEVQAVAEQVQAQNESSYHFVNHFYVKALFFEFPAVRKGYVASTLVLILALICIWCYCQNQNNKEEYRKKCIYAAAVTWMVFFTYASPSPYWIVILYPFMYLMIFIKPQCLRVNLLLNCAYTYLTFLIYVINTFWVYGGASNLDYLLLKGILPEGHDSSESGPYVARYLNNLNIERYMNIITAVCLASAIGLVVVNYKKNNTDECLEAEYERKVCRGFAIFQIAFLWIWFAFSVYAITRW